MSGARARPSPNIWNAPDVYEIENRGVDPDGLIEAAMAARLRPPDALGPALADAGVVDGHGADGGAGRGDRRGAGNAGPFAGLDVLDLGCGAGFHLPRFAAGARSVVGVEPHPPLLARARARAAGLPHVRVRPGLAQDIPLPEASVDVAHARWAYFFGPGCEPGLAELARVMRRGSSAFVIDNDASTSTFGAWFRRDHPDHDPDAVDRFWARQGWDVDRITMRWAFDTRADFEAVVGIEFSSAVAAWILDRHEGTGVDYAVALRSRRY